MITQLTPLDQATAAVPDPGRGLIWIVELGHPGLASWNMATGQFKRHGALPATAAGIALSGDRKQLLITSSAGAVVAVPADDPSAAPAPVAHVNAPLGKVGATVPLTGSGHAIAVSEAQSELLAIRLSDGHVRTLATISGVTGVAANSQDVWAAASTGGEGRLLKVATAGAQGIVGGLLPTGHVTCSADRDLLLAAHPAADRVSAFRFSDGSLTLCAKTGRRSTARSWRCTASPTVGSSS